ncbi:MAG TPA: beta-eliminating lyase-related protein, partial [Longimicrobiales bacterium]|nr:beta-eliminating lyase-related protein [Longimicrobiales bacterium]
MRRAIAGAAVGDASLGDDPTTLELEERVAELLGKERALFFPSGVMANQAALATQGRSGTEVVVEAGAHILHYEEGAAAALSGLQLRAVETPDGLLTSERVRGALRTGSPYQPETSLVALENTHLDSGGRVLPLPVARDVGRLARERGLAVHLDGARLWHAAVASGYDLRDLAAPADTV